MHHTAKGKPEDWVLPMPLQIEYGRLLTSRVNGCESLKQTKEVLRPKNVVKGMCSLIQKYNSRITLVRKDAISNNQAVLQQYANGELSSDQALARRQVVPGIARGKPNITWAHRWLRNFKWSHQKLSAPSNYLPITHPKMACFRKRFRGTLALKKGAR